jgi:hypothetical protein
MKKETMMLKQKQGMGKIAAVLLGLAAGPLWAGTEGTSSTYYGQNAGASGSGSIGSDTFMGYYAGYTNTGAYNTFVGFAAGINNSTGYENIFLGQTAGASNTTGFYNTFVGSSAGFHNTSDTDGTFVGREAGYNSTAPYNTFVGSGSGYSTTIGYENTFLGMQSGHANTAGYRNVTLGMNAGHSNSTGFGNVLLGFSAGYSETGSNKLYIDNCFSGGSCTSPLIYGEFDNHLLKINGVTHVAADGVAKSQMHFSLNNGDYGGFLTSVLPNNFFVSSGARFDSPNWVQLSPDGNAVMAGSGGVGYRIFTHTGGTVGNTFNNPVLRLHIDYSGQFGINTDPVAGHEIHTSSGAYLAGGTWTDASSRAYKHDIQDLSGQDAAAALAALNPVMFRYNDDGEQQHVGFIAEDVPELVAMKDRKGLSPMDIVAVLTKVVQEQKQEIDSERAARQHLEAQLSSVLDRLKKAGIGR